MLSEWNIIYHQLKEDSEALRVHKYKTEKEYTHEFEFMTEVDSKALQSATPLDLLKYN